ncbi:MAG: S-methyl-5'-thioadenosine phosphorylase [Alphaproteobacteria bacterium]|nr:S-methyl-5'-thioadenosine phosphorylase [Alphaproteobacteria bacterium]
MLGVIGGSGVYDLPGLENVRWEPMDTPWGTPSDALMHAELAGQPIVFLPRHGRGHVHSPSSLPYRANIDALKQAGVTDILSVSAVGSLKEELKPGTFVLVDNFIDRTFSRQKSFFGEGCVAHVSVAHPTCGRVGAAVREAAAEIGIDLVDGGTYLTMEGPQFSTLAESNLYRQWGCDVIGMTNMPEAKLAREAEICYATVAMVTDYDCWHPDHDNVTVEQVIKTLLENADHAKALVKAVAPKVADHPDACQKGCDRALDFALITHQDKRDPAVVEKLKTVAGRVL